MQTMRFCDAHESKGIIKNDLSSEFVTPSLFIFTLLFFSKQSYITLAIIMEKWYKGIMAK